MDLGASDTASAILPAVADVNIGFLVYNAAFAPVGDFAKPSRRTTAEELSWPTTSPDSSRRGLYTWHC